MYINTIFLGAKLNYWNTMAASYYIIELSWQKLCADSQCWSLVTYCINSILFCTHQLNTLHKARRAFD